MGKTAATGRLAGVQEWLGSGSSPMRIPPCYGTMPPWLYGYANPPGYSAAPMPFAGFTVPPVFHTLTSMLFHGSIPWNPENMLKKDQKLILKAFAL